jgi:hypothetical protein
MMAIFMPTDFKSLSLNHFLKLQNPSQILSNENFIKPCIDIGSAVQQQNCYISNVNVNATPMMTDSTLEQDSKMRVYSEDDSNSNDSDLSVGQEKVVHNETVEGKINNSINNANNNSKINNINKNNSDDEMSNASSSQYTNSSTRLCSPQNTPREIGEMMRPMQFHEEILRSSQLYAEELLRQRIAAAARLQTVTDPKNHHSPEEPEPSIISKLSFQSNLFSASKLAATDNSINENGNSNNNLFCAKSAINFQNIHSHLSAISQITHNLGSNIKKDDATSLSSLSRESSQSPSGFQQFKQHLRGTHQNHHLHEHNLNLKFSIDNILKADFGRRITEPLLKSSKSRRVARESKQDRDRVSSFSIDEQIGKSSEKPVDQSFSSTSETTSKSDAGTSSSGSGSGTVWPAWVSKSQFYTLTWELMI